MSGVRAQLRPVEESYGNNDGKYVILSQKIQKLTLEPGGPLIDKEGLTRYGLERLDAQVLAATSGLSQEEKALVAAFAQALQELPLPKVAPEKYADRQPREDLGGRKENPIEFAVRVYPIVQSRITTFSEINALDSKLYTALHNWIKKNDIPKSVKLMSSTNNYDLTAGAILDLCEDRVQVARRVYNFGSAMLKRASA